MYARFSSGIYAASSLAFFPTVGSSNLCASNDKDAGGTRADDVGQIFAGFGRKNGKRDIFLWCYDHVW